jgi:hypothetical protein
VFPYRLPPPLQLELIPGLTFASIAKHFPSVLGFSASLRSTAAPKFSLFLGDYEIKSKKQANVRGVQTLFLATVLLSYRSRMEMHKIILEPKAHDGV